MPAPRSKTSSGEILRCYADVLAQREPSIEHIDPWRGQSSCYLPFHGMKASCIEDVFRHLPLLVFVEAFIYEVDLCLLP